MSQVIEVNFYNPDTQEKIHQSFTQVGYKESHREAITVALRDFSKGHATLQSITLGDPETWTKGYWRSMYGVVFTSDMVDDERAMYAVLWSSYKEKKDETTTTQDD